MKLGIDDVVDVVEIETARSDESDLTPRARHMRPRLHAEKSVQGLMHQWNAFSGDGLLTQRIESIEDWEQLWAHGGLAEAASQQSLWQRHQQNQVKRSPTFDESLTWFKKRYGRDGEQ